MTAIAALRELIQKRAIVTHFVVAELKSGHRDKVLGNLWQLLDPMAFMLVYYFVWSVVLGTRGPDFTAYLLTGIITFNFFRSTAISSSNILPSRARLIREIYFPRAALPTAVTIARLYDFIWALGALFLLLVWLIYQQAHMGTAYHAKITHPVSFGLNALWFPLTLIILFAFTLGAAYVFAVVGALFRDTPNILNFALRIWFYLSPLFYYPDDVPRKVWLFYRLNPFTHFFRMVRNALIYNQAPTFDGVTYIAAISVAVLVAGFTLFVRYEGSVTKQL